MTSIAEGERCVGAMELEIQVHQLIKVWLKRRE